MLRGARTELRPFRHRPVTGSPRSPDSVSVRRGCTPGVQLEGQLASRYPPGDCGHLIIERGPRRSDAVGVDEGPVLEVGIAVAGRDHQGQPPNVFVDSTVSHQLTNEDRHVLVANLRILLGRRQSDHLCEIFLVDTALGGSVVPSDGECPRPFSHDPAHDSEERVVRVQILQALEVTLAGTSKPAAFAHRRIEYSFAGRCGKLGESNLTIQSPARSCTGTTSFSPSLSIESLSWTPARENRRPSPSSSSGSVDGGRVSGRASRRSGPRLRMADLDGSWEIPAHVREERQIVSCCDDSRLLDELSKPPFRGQVGEEVRKEPRLAAPVNAFEVVLEFLAENGPGDHVEIVFLEAKLRGSVRRLRELAHRPR